MAWWESEGRLVGDEPLDLAQEFLERLSKVYLDEQDRRPRLAEILACIELSLRHRADELAEGCDELVVAEVVAKTRKKPKNQEVRAGDVFEIPLGNGYRAFGRISPQIGVFEFFDVKSRQRPPISELARRPSFRFPATVMLGPLKEWRWRVIGHLPYEGDKFSPQLFRIAGQVAHGQEMRAGFVDPTSELRRATPEEMKTVPENSLWNAEMLERELRRRLG